MKGLILLLLCSCADPPGGRHFDPQYPQFEACERVDAPRGSTAKICRDKSGQAWFCGESGSCSPIMNYR